MCIPCRCTRAVCWQHKGLWDGLTVINVDTKLKFYKLEGIILLLMAYCPSSGADLEQVGRLGHARAGGGGGGAVWSCPILDNNLNGLK